MFWIYMKSTTQVWSACEPQQFYGLLLGAASIGFVPGISPSVAALIVLIISPLIIFGWFNWGATSGQKMQVYRKAIESADGRILSALSIRRNFVKHISSVKEKNNMPVKDKKRRADHIANLKWIAYKEGYRRRDLEKLFDTIIKQSEEYQYEKRRDDGSPQT